MAARRRRAPAKRKPAPRKTAKSRQISRSGRNERRRVAGKDGPIMRWMRRRVDLRAGVPAGGNDVQLPDAVLKPKPLPDGAVLEAWTLDDHGNLTLAEARRPVRFSPKVARAALEHLETVQLAAVQARERDMARHATAVRTAQTRLDDQPSPEATGRLVFAERSFEVAERRLDELVQSYGYVDRVQMRRTYEELRGVYSGV